MKKILASALVLGAAVVGLHATAGAATRDVNIYGASAQYLYWNDAADDFLRTKGCTITGQGETTDKKHGVTVGNPCTGYSNDKVVIRYSAKASMEGPNAIKCDDSLASSSEKCVTGDAGVPAGADPKCYRKMADETTLVGTVVNGKKCYDVTLGASDVAGSAFVQESHGQLKGPNGGGFVDRVLFPIDMTGYRAWNPTVVPFGFFANNSVTVTKCTAPDANEPTAGAHKAISAADNFCIPDANGQSEDCIGYYKCVSGTCSGGVNVGQACTKATNCPDVALSATSCESMPLQNLSRLMATMIFSGQAWYWSDFGGWFTSDPIVVCMRHAGSGTHAALYWTVMYGNWGAFPYTTESAGDPTVWFNDGSTDEMKCINTLTGAIGYADADQLEGTSNYANTHALKYQCVEPRRTTIRNGLYDFWTTQWTYASASEPPAIEQVMADLMAFASSSVPASKAKYWATGDEMVYMRASEEVFPGYRGAINPLFP
ncbi:MAG: hypothetical protein AB1634_09330 [Thermodesulfobacteriota bacterium]